MKISVSPFILATFLSCSQILFADTIVLKNGDRLEGRVLRDEGDNYVVEVNVTATIKDEKIIPKSEVKFVSKDKADEKAFEKLADYVPTPDFLNVEGYQQRIRDLEGFVSEYPKSGNVYEAKKMLTKLKEELAVVENGGIKFGDKLISGDEYAENAYEFDARIAERNIEETIARRDFLSALRLFSEYDSVFNDAENRDELVAKIQQVLKAYGASLDANLASLDSRLEKRKTGLDRMSGEDRANTQRALDDQMAKIQARYEKEKANRGSWVTPDAFHKESLTEARRQVETETRRLSSAKNQKELEKPVAEAYREVWGQLESGTEEEKKAALSAAKSYKIPAPYLEKLQERANLPAK
ncbi:PTPDL family protein [Luteolibacter algae]|uniref:PTPDL family protein n=1 Tax=Luteolibacter algae TaxID=454151 RepID=A0ABW5DBV2_9BACT